MAITQDWIDHFKRANQYFNQNPGETSYTDPGPSYNIDALNIPQYSFIPQTSLATTNFTPKIDPSLSIDNLIQQFNTAQSKSLIPTAQSIVESQRPFIQKDVENFLTSATDVAKQDILRRNIAGSSTEQLKIGKDIPLQAADLLAKRENEALIQALPFAQREKELGIQGVQFTAGLRKMVTDEQFQSMSLDQKQNLAEADMNLRIELDKLDKQFQTQKEMVRQKFEAAQNQADRDLAMYELRTLENERKKARSDAFTKSIFSLAGAGIGFASGGGLVGAGVGATVGNALGDIFSF